jgi:hypothetical protein
MLEPLSTDEGRTHAMLEEVWRLPRGENRFVTVVVPEQFRRPSLLSAAGRESFRLKFRLLSEPGVVVAVVPAVSPTSNPQGCTPSHLAVRVLISGVHGGSVRALEYARSLGIVDTRAVSFAFDQEEAARVERDWLKMAPLIPLDLSDAPYRDIGDPLLGYLRALTTDPDAAVNVVMPEIAVRDQGKASRTHVVKSR